MFLSTSCSIFCLIFSPHLDLFLVKLWKIQFCVVFDWISVYRRCILGFILVSVRFHSFPIVNSQFYEVEFVAGFNSLSLAIFSPMILNLRELFCRLLMMALCLIFNQFLRWLPIYFCLIIDESMGNVKKRTGMAFHDLCCLRYQFTLFVFHIGLVMISSRLFAFRLSSVR